MTGAVARENICSLFPGGAVWFMDGCIQIEVDECWLEIPMDQAQDVLLALNSVLLRLPKGGPI